MTNKQLKEIWASPLHPLGSYLYRTYNSTDFDIFNEYYHDLYDPWWVKSNISSASPESKFWYPTLAEIWQKDNNHCQFLFKLTMEPETFIKYGAPQYLWESVNVQKSQVEIELQWFEKTSTRLPEASFFSFEPFPQNNNHEWKMDKLGELVSPNQVILNGSQAQHGVWSGIYYTNPQGDGLIVESLDSGLACPAPYTTFPVTRKPKFFEGMAFNLFNNIWNTNYILYFPFLKNEDSNSRFRFTLKILSSKLGK